MNKKTVAGWCLYDWANSAYPTIIMTFVFATYFSEAIATSPEEGTIIWGNTMAVAGLFLAVLAPICGAIADHGGHRAKWLLTLTVICIGATAMLWFATPGEESLLWAVSFVAISTIAFEFSMVFYNAYLPDVAPRTHWGRVSGWGWGLGYFGGLTAMVIALVGFIQAETPWFGVGQEDTAHVRASFLLVAVWMAVFCIPTFLTLPKVSRQTLPLHHAIPKGLRELRHSLIALWQEKLVMHYLLARMIYTDGLNTLFVFGGIYAAGVFGMSLSEVIVFGIVLNVTSGLGAFAFGWLDDRIGPKKVLLISIACLSVLVAVGAFATDVRVFWGVGLFVGIFLGPTQSASRTMLARLAPPEMTTEYFGLYALSGKATSFLGPWLLAMATAAFDSQRAGMAVIVGLLVIGGIWLWKIDFTSARGAE